jgi:hypothetical protein
MDALGGDLGDLLAQLQTTQQKKARWGQLGRRALCLTGFKLHYCSQTHTAPSTTCSPLKHCPISPKPTNQPPSQPTNRPTNRPTAIATDNRPTKQPTASVRLSERNVVELVIKLKQLGLLGDDLLHTINGKEYITTKRLRADVEGALRAAGGRLELSELPALVGVDLTHCEKQVGG